MNEFQQKIKLNDDICKNQPLSEHEFNINLIHLLSTR